MPSLGEVGGATFDSFEGIRIIAPGLIVYGTGIVVFQTVAPHAETGQATEAFVSLVSSLVVGLFLYYWDFPARSAVFNRDLPSDFLVQKYPKKSRPALVTTYLLILNTVMPANIRNRSLYMGSMYRIGLEMTLAISLGSAVVFSAAVLNYGTVATENADRSRHVAALAILFVFLAGLAVHVASEKRNKATADALRGIGSNVADRVRNRSMLIYGLGIFLILVPRVNFPKMGQMSDEGGRRTACVGAAVCFIYWAVRYVAGDRQQTGRRALDPPSAALLFALPLVLISAIYASASRSVVHDSAVLTGWTAVACLATFLILVHGHDRKLRGTYLGARRWLESNEAAYKPLLPDDV